MWLAGNCSIPESLSELVQLVWYAPELISDRNFSNINSAVKICQIVPLPGVIGLRLDMLFYSYYHLKQRNLAGDRTFHCHVRHPDM